MKENLLLLDQPIKTTIKGPNVPSAGTKSKVKSLWVAVKVALSGIATIGNKVKVKKNIGARMKTFLSESFGMINSEKRYLRRSAIICMMPPNLLKIYKGP